MKKNKSKIPKFKNLKQEAEFWDTHNFTDYEDELKNASIIFELEKPRTETLVLRMQKELKDRLKKIARQKGLNVSTLSRMWLMEKLQTTN